MAQQKFPAVFREALRNAHGDKCIYCGRFLLFRETKVDHVLPESCLQDEDKATELRRRFGLPDSFDILGHENLAPSCEPCNGQKSDMLLMPGYIPIILGRVQKQIPKLRELLEQRQAEVNLDKMLRAIAVAVERKVFSKSAILNAISESIREDPVATDIERKDELFFNQEYSVVVTEHARIRAADRKIDLKRLYGDLSAALKRGPVRARRVGNARLYELRAADNIKVFYEIRGKKVIIVTAYREIDRRRRA